MLKVFSDSLPGPSAWLDRMGGLGLFFGRIITGYLWFTQLGWKTPPTFGCPADFAISTAAGRTSGLCDWVGEMTLYSTSPLHQAFVRDFVAPNIRWFGYFVYLMELFLAVSLVFGFLSRLGGLTGFVQAVNLYIGLAHAPGEWYWSYGMLYTLHIIFFFLPPGRVLGLDGLVLIPRLKAAAERGNGLARLVLLLM